MPKQETINCDLCGLDTSEPHPVDISKPDSEPIATLVFCPSCLSSIFRAVIPKLPPSERVAKLAEYVKAIRHVPSREKDIDGKVTKLRNDILEALARLEQMEFVE